MTQETLHGLFKGEQLTKVRRAVGLSELELARELGLSAADVAAWEDGTQFPNFEQLEALATLLGVKVEFFLRVTPVLPAQAYFRAAPFPRPADLSPATRKVILQFMELCRYQAQLEHLVGNPTEPTFPHMEVSASDPEGLARTVRQHLGLDSLPVGDLNKIMESQGVKIFRLEIPGEEFSGLSLRNFEFGAAVLLSASDVFVRQRFTLCHEYAHLLANNIMDTVPTVCDLDWEREPEKNANRFAAAFLIPAQSSELWRFASEHPKPSPEELTPFVTLFGASREAVARRLVELEMSPPDLVGQVIAANLAEPRVPHPVRRVAGWRKVRGRQFVALASEAYHKGVISLSKLAEYLGVDPETAFQFVERKGKG